MSLSINAINYHFHSVSLSTRSFPICIYYLHFYVTAPNTLFIGHTFKYLNKYSPGYRVYTIYIKSKNYRRIKRKKNSAHDRENLKKQCPLSFASILCWKINLFLIRWANKNFYIWTVLFWRNLMRNHVTKCSDFINMDLKSFSFDSVSKSRKLKENQIYFFLFFYILSM